MRHLTQKLIDFIIKISEKILPEKIVKLEKKILTVQVVLYIFFGVLTTICNIGVFALLNNVFKINENIANILAILTAVLLAYFTNKDLVFNSTASNFKEKFLEFCKFMLGRAFTMIIEYIGCALMFRFIPIPNIVSKCIITIIVIIMNFFISKFFAFKK